MSATTAFREVEDLDADSNANVTNLKIGIYELALEAVSNQSISKGKGRGYLLHIHINDYPKFIKIYNKLKDQVKVWARDHIKLAMVTTAKRVGITLQGDVPLSSWQDLLTAWTSRYTRSKKPSEHFIELMYEVLFQSFAKQGYWNETYEKQFMSTHSWIYTDADTIDHTQHLGKGKGAKLKSNIAKIIAACKAEVVKEVNRHAMNSHGITINGKMTSQEKWAQLKQEIEDGGKKKKRSSKRAVFRSSGEVIDLSDIVDDEDEDEPHRTETVAAKEEPNRVGASPNNMGFNFNGVGNGGNSAGMAVMDPKTGMMSIPMSSFFAMMAGGQFPIPMAPSPPPQVQPQPQVVKEEKSSREEQLLEQLEKMKVDQAKIMAELDKQRKSSQLMETMRKNGSAKQCKCRQLTVLVSK